MVRFQRLQAKRELLEREAPLDPRTNQRNTLKLNVRLRQAVENGQADELIAALELFPEFPVAPPEFIEQFKRDIAERASPVSGDMVSLRSAYTYLLGTATKS